MKELLKINIDSLELLDTNQKIIEDNILYLKNLKHKNKEQRKLLKRLKLLKKRGQKIQKLFLK